MDILHIITHGGWAGSESIAASIANEQATRGDNVTVLLRRHNSFKDKDILKKFSPLVSIFWVEQNETHPDNQMKNLMNNKLFVSNITKIDILHAHLPYGCLLGKLIKEKLGIKFEICVTMHVRFHPLYYLADKLFTVANWQKQEVPNDYSGEVYTIENFICNVTDSYKKKLFLLKRKFYIRDNCKYIIYIGRLDLVKGADILIRAFNKANPKGYKLIIVGDGAESSYLKKIASKNIIFTGKIFNAACMLDIADICVIPSRFESFGLVLLEAINSGCRIIATNIPSFKEILRSDSYLFDNESVNSLSNKIKEYTNNSSLGVVDKKIIEKYSLSNAICQLDLAYASKSIESDMIKSNNIEDNYNV